MSESQTSWQATALELLRSRAGRTGGARLAVVELLEQQSCCLSAQEIFDQLRSQGRSVGIASVYRTLDTLRELGLVQRIEVGTGVARFEPIRTGDGHHHHMVCEDCGRVEAFADDELERSLRRLEGRAGYSIAGHDVILRGACGDCRPG
jgi:Fur family transcriptional regulator, ferric uptake regulator